MRVAVLAASAAASAAVILIPLAADAAPPMISRDSGSGAFVDVNTCMDPLGVVFDYDEVVHQFVNAAGEVYRISFTGTVHVTYTNLSSGLTYSPNSSGPGTIDLMTGALAVRGSNGTVWNEQGVLVSVQGRVVYDASGAIVSIVGHSQGICSAVGSAI